MCFTVPFALEHHGGPPDLLLPELREAKEGFMLVLTRKTGQKIVVPECEVTVTILEIRGNRVRLGISAPSRMAVHREEIWQQHKQRAVGVAPDFK